MNSPAFYNNNSPAFQLPQMNVQPQSSVPGGVKCTIVGVQGPSGSTNINDASVSPSSTWSSKKTSDEIAAVKQDAHNSMEQTLASANWTFVHNLGKVPSVVILDPNGIQYKDLNLTIMHSKDVNGVYTTVNVIFPSPVTGSIHCN